MTGLLRQGGVSKKSSCHRLSPVRYLSSYLLVLIILGYRTLPHHAADQGGCYNGHGVLQTTAPSDLISSPPLVRDLPAYRHPLRFVLSTRIRYEYRTVPYPYEYSSCCTSSHQRTGGAPHAHSIRPALQLHAFFFRLLERRQTPRGTAERERRGIARSDGARLTVGASKLT